MSNEASEQPLTEQLDAMRAAANERMPEEFKTMQAQAIEQIEKGTAERALREGDPAPDFTLKVADTGEEVTLSERLREGPVVLSFYRGNWCVYCNTEIRALERYADRFAAAGASVYCVGPETQENAVEMMTKGNGKVPCLFDADGAVMDAYGLSFEVPEFLKPMYEQRMGFPERNMTTQWSLPVPATYVVGQDGVIAASHVAADYTRRMDPEAILSVLGG